MTTLIDAHQHLYSKPDALPKLVDACRANGIAKVCLSACGEQYEQPENPAVKAAFEQYPDLIVGLGYVRLGIDGPDAVDGLHKDGFKGLKVIAPRKNYNDQSFFPIYARAAARRMPILFHTGPVQRFPLDGSLGTDSATMRPVFLDGIARRFPELTIIGAHLGGCWIDEACSVASCNPNVFFDLSGIINLLWDKEPAYFQTVLFWNRAKHKFVFGVDNDEKDIPVLIERYNSLMDRLQFPEELKRAVFHDTMARILT